MKRMKKILGAAIGNCVHVAGLFHFLKLAEAEGYVTCNLGPAVTIERLIKEIQREEPELIAISYRLSPEVAQSLFESLKVEIRNAGLKNLKILFGGTPPVCEAARASGLFLKVFDGTETQREIGLYLRGGKLNQSKTLYAETLLGRIQQKYPYPILRHHFGRPTMIETIKGAAAIAKSEVLDVLSIGPDQNAQEYFFHPELMTKELEGAGGVPLRRPEDLEEIYLATRTGNYPLVRCYAGTQDLLKWAEMSVRTIHNAWAAIPLCWYSVIDGRSNRTLVEAISENQRVMRWYAERGIPVEVNEAHQWSLRDAHDSVAVAMAFLAAYNAKQAGVKNYIAQFMFNTPPGTSASMDIAKMLAKKELIEELEDTDFKMIREVRGGLAHFSAEPQIAKGQLAASAVISLSLKPHILHVVGFSEGDHASLPEELIESCNIVHGVLRDVLHGFPELNTNPAIVRRKNELKSEAMRILKAIESPAFGRSKDPWTDPEVIARAIEKGLLDAPHFKGNPYLNGNVITRAVEGAWYASDYFTGEPINETKRILNILNRL
jgi:hypothetical protein